MISRVWQYYEMLIWRGINFIKGMVFIIKCLQQAATILIYSGYTITGAAFKQVSIVEI